MMTKALEDMSLEELWQLFSDFFKRTSALEWKDWYEGRERLRLLSLPEHQIVCSNILFNI